jgi:hypothetical protein
MQPEPKGLSKDRSQATASRTSLCIHAYAAPTVLTLLWEEEVVSLLFLECRSRALKALTSLALMDR